VLRHRNTLRHSSMPHRSNTLRRSSMPHRSNTLRRSSMPHRRRNPIQGAFSAETWF
jgi:hypothetical protein